MSADEVFDLDAVEDEGKPFPFRFGGQDFTFPPDPDIVAMEFFQKGDFQSALFVLLGQDDYERMDSIPAEVARMGQARFTKLMEAYGRHLGVDPGKIVWALQVCSAGEVGQAGAVEADFHRFYHLDVGALIRGRRWRKLVNLLVNLPPESATSRALRDVGPAEDWTTETYLLAAAVNALMLGNWQRSGRKGAPRPKLITAPGAKATDGEHFGGEALAPADVDAILAARYETPPEEVTPSPSSLPPHT